MSTATPKLCVLRYVREGFLGSEAVSKAELRRGCFWRARLVALMMKGRWVSFSVVLASFRRLRVAVTALMSALLV